jgi:hypothetical protein
MTLSELRSEWERRRQLFAKFGASVNAETFATAVLEELEELETAIAANPPVSSAGSRDATPFPSLP